MNEDDLKSSPMDIDGEVGKEEIIKDGDWILKWNESETGSGFELFTPCAFTFDKEDEEVHIPMGGVVLSAFYFLLCHDWDGVLSRYILERANSVHEQMGYDETTKKTLT